MPDLISQLYRHVDAAHGRGCKGRVECTCGYDKRGEELIKLTVARIRTLKHEFNALRGALKEVRLTSTKEKEQSNGTAQKSDSQKSDCRKASNVCDARNQRPSAACT